MKFKFSVALRNALHKRGMTNVRLAKIMGVYPQQIVRWKSSDDAKISLAARICDALEIDIIEFIEMGKVQDDRPEI